MKDEKLTDEKARSILFEISCDEWYRPILDHLAAHWAIERIAKLEADLDEAKRRITELETK